jgi:YVTN family beta-propeller protein
MHKFNTTIKQAILSLMLCAAAFTLFSCGGSSPGTSNTTTYAQNRYDYPTDITASPDGSKLYVVNNIRSTISIVDTASMSVIGEMKTSCNPRHLAINAAGTEMYVSHDDVSSCKLSPLSAASYDGTRLSIIDLAMGAVTKEINISDTGSSNARNMFWIESANRLFATALNGKNVFIDTSTQTTDSSVKFEPVAAPADTADFHYENKLINFPDPPVSASVTSDGATAVLPYTLNWHLVQTCKAVNAAVGCNTANQIMTDTEFTKIRLALINAATKAQYAVSPWPLTSCTSPSHTLIINNNFVFISCRGTTASSANDKIILVDISNTAATSAAVKATITVGDKPSVMAMSPDGNTLLVINTGSASLYAIPWSQLKLGTGIVYGLQFSIGASSSDLAVIGDYAYVTDQLTSTIYKIPYKDSTKSTGTVSFDSSSFASFPY